MNIKPSVIEIRPAVLAPAPGTYCLAPHVISLVFAAPVQFEPAVSPGGPRVSALLPEHRRGKLWENLSYGALWLSGLLAVSLCFL
jgi:hypothetical protein